MIFSHLQINLNNSVISSLLILANYGATARKGIDRTKLRSITPPSERWAFDQYCLNNTRLGNKSCERSTCPAHVYRTSNIRVKTTYRLYKYRRSESSFQTLTNVVHKRQRHNGRLGTIDSAMFNCNHVLPCPTTKQPDSVESYHVNITMVCGILARTRCLTSDGVPLTQSPDVSKYRFNGPDSFTSPS